MKRKNEKVPEFDEIIFENRNKTYGAYDLRKRYKSATSLSIMGGVAIFTMLTAAITYNTEDGTAKTPPQSGIIELSDRIIPVNVAPPELKLPPELTRTTTNLQPVITSDTSEITGSLTTTDNLIATIKDGDVNDTVAVTYIGNPDPEVPAEIKPFIVVEEMPEFPGGKTALLKYIGENLKYPSDAQENNIQGRVFLKFVVNPDGSVDRIEIIKGVYSSLDNEAVRVVKTLPRFKPGKQRGVPVPVWFTIPVLFRMNVN